MAFFRRSPDKPARKVLRVGTLNPVKALDPRDAQDTVSVFFLTQVFEAPYLQPPDADTPPRPLLFDGPLRREEAPLERPIFSGRVRAGVKFSDGTPLLAEHVAASLNRAEGFITHARARAAGDRVVFELERPHPRFALLLSNHFCSVVLERGGERLGTGAYVLAPDATADAMRLVRNPHFRGVTAIDEVVFAYYPPGAGDSHEALIDALESGHVHYSDALSRDDVGKLQTVRKHFQTGISTCSLYFDTERPYLRDARVRRALAMAVDRGELSRISYENALAFTATSLLPPFMGSFRDGIRTNLEAARELLREAAAEGAAPLPPKLRMVVPWGPRAYLPHPTQVADAIIEQLGKIGVGVSLLPTRDSVEFYRIVSEGAHDLALIGWIADSADPAELLEVQLHTRAVPQTGKSPAVRGNMSRWSDTETDALLDRYRLDGREEGKRAILERVAQQVPLLPLMYGPSIAVCAWELTGFVPTAIGFPRFADMDLERKP
jgi:ABC-type transport system substrate-binding protein